MNNRAISFITITFLLLTWAALTGDTPFTEQRVISSLKLPSPSDVYAAANRLGVLLIEYAMATFVRVLSGLAAGSFGGVITGLCMNASRRFRAVLDPLIELIRPCPPIALIPFAIMWCGLGFSGQFAIVTLASFMIVVIATVTAANNVPRHLIWAAKTLGADRCTIYASVILPAIQPALIGAFRLASGTAFGITCGAEYLGAQGGLGYLIRNARTTLQTDAILTAVIALGCLSFGLDWLIRIWGEKITNWQSTTNESQ